jgi:hypothetical protein
MDLKNKAQTVKYGIDNNDLIKIECLAKPITEDNIFSYMILEVETPQ